MDLRAVADLRARALEHDAARLQNIRTVAEIEGETAVSGVRLVSGERLDAVAVFTYIGLAPNTAFLHDRLKLDAAGRIATDAAMATTTRGWFVAGLARAGSPGRAIASAGEGTAAAVAAHEFLGEKA